MFQLSSSTPPYPFCRRMPEKQVRAGIDLKFLKYTVEDALEEAQQGKVDVLIISKGLSTGIDKLQHHFNSIVYNGLPVTFKDFEQINGKRMSKSRQEDTVGIIFSFQTH
jgi:hypothetical protein